MHKSIRTHTPIVSIFIMQLGNFLRILVDDTIMIDYYVGVLIKEVSDMGLDVSHNCWVGAYSAFNTFRRRIAEIDDRQDDLAQWDNRNDECFLVKDERAGNALMRLEVDDGYEHAGTTATIFDIEDLKRDPISFLLWHSDCGGLIPFGLCKPLAHELLSLADRVDEGELCGGHIQANGGLKAVLKRFAKGLFLAHKNKESVEFC